MDLSTMATRFPTRDAVVLDDPPARVGYAELDAAANRLAHGLRAAGLRRGDALAFALDNRIEVFEVFWAAMRLGLSVVPVNHHLRRAEVRHILADSGARAVVAAHHTGTEVGAATRGLPLRTRLSVQGDIAGFTPLAQLGAGQPATMPEEPWEGQIVFYSSGTTGQPKGIIRAFPPCRPGEGPTFGSELAAGFGLDEGDRYLSTGPLYHSAPLAFSTTQHRIGATAVVMRRFDAAASLDLLERERITTSQWVPTMFTRLLALEGEARLGRDLHRHRVAFHAAAPCPVSVKHRMIEWWGPILVEYYSASEGGRTMIDSHEWLERPGSVGRHWRGGNVWILDEEGQELPPYQQGRIYFDAPSLGRFHYLNDPAATAAAFSGDRFTVGEVGYLDDDGFLFLTDRATDLVISGGVNIYPREVEKALLEHPAVGDVGVVGVPDDDLGEQLVAVVVPADGTTLVAEDLDAFCQARLARFKCPRAYEFADELPRSEAGKLLKRQLREELSAKGRASEASRGPGPSGLSGEDA